MVPTDAERRARLTPLVRCELDSVIRDDEVVNWCTSHDRPATHAYPHRRPVPAPATT